MSFFLVLAAYVLGSIPFGFLVGRLWNLDIRRHGSGNIGATNVLRTLGPVPGGVVFALDFLKGLVVVYLGYWLGGGHGLALLLGVAVILGHVFSLFLGFKGGKGVATALGVLMGWAPEVFVISLVLIAAVIVATRYVSLASIFVPFVVVVLMWLFKKPPAYVAATLLVAVIILIRHVPNVKRLLTGTEFRL